MTLPFAWGVATSAYQIEGGRHEGGKGTSIWDKFNDEGRLPASGDVAVDHYHRLDEDLDLLADLGVNAYRFSTAWTRIVPDGNGRVSNEGLGFYDRLITGLEARGIEPCLTLYHWDLPQALQDKGGWESRDTIDAFTTYATILAGTFGDRVGRWVTQNEPWVSAFPGHRDGVFAPGLTSWETALVVSHNLLLAHGRATKAIREVAPEAEVGIALDCRPSEPADEASVAANRYFDGFRNRWYFDPVFGLGYPDDMVDAYIERGYLPSGLEDLVEEGDQEEIATPIDFLGLNYYTTVTISAEGEESDEPEGPVGPDAPKGFTEMGWRNDPRGLTDFLERVARTYAPASILITENGASYTDGPDANGRVRDSRRIEYLDSHMAAVLDAREAGVPVDGYFVWSLLDNVEWTQGFSQRFGLVWVDEDSGRRIPKDSYYWYRDRINTSGI